MIGSLLFVSKKCCVTNYNSSNVSLPPPLPVGKSVEHLSGGAFSRVVSACGPGGAALLKLSAWCGMRPCAV